MELQSMLGIELCFQKSEMCEMCEFWCSRLRKFIMAVSPFWTTALKPLLALRLGAAMSLNLTFCHISDELPLIIVRRSLQDQ
jgi:hypothetical protein